MTRSGAAPGPDGAGRPRVRSLLGIYPVPALHLAGAPVTASPAMPSRWQPSTPLPQFGIDYTFLNGCRGEPVTWLDQQPITVRIAGRHAAGQASAVAEVVAELAHLTGLPLRLGSPWPAEFDPGQVPSQEIHVGFLPAARVSGLMGFGGAVLTDTRRYYTSGYAAVYNTATHSVPGPVPGLASQVPATLRHELAHAIGLGHAARPSLLMHYQIPVEQDKYGPGDRHGLAVLGQARLTGNYHSPRHRRRSLLCAV
jgi:hypothetical protein